MSKETKITNIKKSIELNSQKIEKLRFINFELSEVLKNLESEPTEVVPPTETERSEQSRIDKENFQQRLKTVQW